MMTERPRTAQPKGWDTGATDYDRFFTPHFRDYAADALRFAGVRQGSRVLDVAAGPGTLALLAAEMGAAVVATDFSPEMIARLREHIAAAHLTNIAAEVMDGQSLALPDASFDAAFSMFGLIFFPDRAAGFRELHRVLRPGGIAGVSSWSHPARSPAGGVFMRAVRQALPDRPAPAIAPPGSSLQDPQLFEREMREAGFTAVTIHTIPHTWEIASVQEYWNTFRLTPVSSLTEGENRAVRAALADIVREEYGDGPVTLETEAHIGIGVK